MAGAYYPKVEERIGVQAPPDVIWEIVSDIDRWPEWNPIYPRASGLLRIDETLSLTVALPGEPPREIAPKVMDWVPNAQILWTEKRMFGQVTVIRYIEIDQLSETSAIFANGEQYRSWYLRLAHVLAKRVRRPSRAGFAAFCEALRERAEALWRERAGTTT